MLRYQGRKVRAPESSVVGNAHRPPFGEIGSEPQRRVTANGAISKILQMLCIFRITSQPAAAT